MIELLISNSISNELVKLRAGPGFRFVIDDYCGFSSGISVGFFNVTNDNRIRIPGRIGCTHPVQCAVAGEWPPVNCAGDGKGITENLRRRQILTRGNYKA